MDSFGTIALFKYFNIRRYLKQFLFLELLHISNYTNTNGYVTKKVNTFICRIMILIPILLKIELKLNLISCCQHMKCGQIYFKLEE